MEVNRTRLWFYGLTVLWLILILTIGIWWIYLIIQLGELFEGLPVNAQFNFGRFPVMAKWEGLTFFVLLTLLSSSLLFVYWQDLKKTGATQSFFASLTHEMKTPLASIRLQSEVLQEELKEMQQREHGPPGKELERLKTLNDRLLKDAYKLEQEFDRSLELARVERGAKVSLSKLEINKIILNSFLALPKDWDFELQTNSEYLVMGDEYSVNLIFRNLIDNTLRHHQGSLKKIIVSLEEQGKYLVLTYDDNGSAFTGKLAHLGKLFYRHRSAKGSGIGLYLCAKLMKSMRGDFAIVHQGRLRFKLKFKLGQRKA